MKIMITGASGFISHHATLAFLEAGHEVIGVDKRPIPPNHSLPTHFIQTDVRDLGYRDLLGIDTVLHLAFVTNIPNSVRHPKETTHDNICMTAHILEAARETGVKKFLYPSTASLYGNNPTPWTEDMSAIPIEPYSFQKLACEQLCQLYTRQYSLPTTIFRFFQVYGHLQRDDTALAAFLRLKKEGKPITLTETTAQSAFRSGQRDFIYAGDLAEALVKAAESDRTGHGEVLNVCTGRVNTMEEVADAIGGEVTFIERRPWEVERHEGSTSKIKEMLEWESHTDVLTWLRGQV